MSMPIALGFCREDAAFDVRAGVPIVVVARGRTRVGARFSSALGLVETSVCYVVNFRHVQAQSINFGGTWPAAEDQ